jgi:crotonobetainyl-CoA:carnitine CoA-transferase CaiB-like acyl-CoA transferase
VLREGGLLMSRLPEGQTYRAPGLPFEVDQKPVVAPGVDVPAAGADTETVLRALGLSDAQIALARGAGRAVA